MLSTQYLSLRARQGKRTSWAGGIYFILFKSLQPETELSESGWITNRRFSVGGVEKGFAVEKTVYKMTDIG